MSGFQFPPPPPPPPPRASLASNDVNRGQHIRSNRGNGRGRGRGAQSTQSHGERPGHHYHQLDRQTADDGSWSKTLASHHESRVFKSPHSSYSGRTTHVVNPSALPPGTHVNPDFLMKHDNPNRFPQTSTSVTNGVQSSVLQSAAGHKRKLETVRGSQQDKKRPGPPTAPSVPSFGANVVLSQQNGNGTADIARKQPLKSLGLIPQSGNPQYPSSDSDAEDDAVDEEALYAEIGTALTFEHNGSVTSLSSAADLVDWKNERRRNWPTKHRISEKFEKKRKIGEQRERLITEALTTLNSPKRSTTFDDKLCSGSISTALSNDVDCGDVVASRHLKDVNVLPTSNAKILEIETSKRKGERRLSSGEVYSWEKGSHQTASSLTSMLTIPTNASTEVVGDEAKQAADQNNASAGSEGAEIEVSASLLSPDSHPTFPSDEESDEDGPPEEKTAKPSLPPEGRRAPVCKYFAASGRCRNSYSCRFRHDSSHAVSQPLSASTQRQVHSTSAQRYVDRQSSATSKTAASDIFSLLVEREQDDRDVLALRVIKSLGDAGFFTAPEHGR